jgi:hypothetical protein
MLKHLYFILLLTFVTGLTAGIYGFFMTQVDTSPDSSGTQMEDSSGFEIRATVYGGCERVGCTSFKLREDGSYTYLSPDAVHSYARFEDEISPRQLERIAELLMGAKLARIGETTTDDICPVMYDGIAYRFDIRRENETFSFDTCVHNIKNEELFIELIKYFAIMEATHLTL